MSKPPTNLIYFDFRDRFDFASKKIVQSQAKIMNNVIQLDVRRAKLEKEKRDESKIDAEMCLNVADAMCPKWFPNSKRALIIEAIVQHCDEPEYVRQALWAMGEAV